MGEYFKVIGALIFLVVCALVFVKALINTYQGKSFFARRRRCKTCSHVGKTVFKRPGSLAVELLLVVLAGLGGLLVIFLVEKIGIFAFVFLLLALPSAMYSHMRILGRRTVCAKCGSANLDP